MHSVPLRHVSVVEGRVAPTSFPPGFLSQSAMLDVLNPEKFDVAVMSWNVRYLTLPRAIVRGKRRRIPVLLWGHGTSKTPNFATDLLRRIYGRLADGVILYDEHTAADLKTMNGFSERNVFVAQNALDQSSILSAKEAWSRDASKLRDFRAEHRLIPEKTFILVSRLLPENQGHLLVEMMTELRKECPEAKFIVVGDGPDRPRLERLTQDSCLGQSFVFTGAIYDEQQLAPWMLSSAALVYPGNMGLSLLHAFGYGLPVITGNRKQGHGPEIHALRHGWNGLFFRDGDVTDLLNQCRSVIASPDRRTRMSQAALATVTNDYTIDHMVAGFVDALEHAASGILTDGMRVAA
ncbi:MAG: glycosyltransferase family 4 protein [Planctomycetaceae bacterium]